MCPRAFYICMWPVRTCIRTIHTCTRTYVRTYVYSAWSSCPVPRTAYPLVPRVNGSLPRLLRSDLLRRSTPLRTASAFPSLPSPPPLSAPHGVHLFVFSFTCYIMPRLTWFVCSFLRSFVLLLPWAARRFGDFNARQLLFSRLLSPSLSDSFPALPFLPPPAPGYPRAPLFSAAPSPSPFRSGAFPRLTGIFGATPFDCR